MDNFPNGGQLNDFSLFGNQGLRRSPTFLATEQLSKNEAFRNCLTLTPLKIKWEIPN